MIAKLLCLSPLLVATLVAQTPPDQPAEEPPQQAGIEETLEAVAQAHRPGEEEPEPLIEFRSRLRITPLRQDTDSVEIELDASFLEREEGLDLLRYAVQEPGSTLERGHDQSGFWARTEDRVIKLAGKDYVQETTEVRRHIRLAQQLLSFLDPRTAFAKVEFEAEVRREDLAIAKRKSLPTKVFRGRIESFPLFAPPSEDNPAPAAELTFWVGAEDHLLAAVQVRPLDGNDRPGQQGEFFLLRGGSDREAQDYSERDGVLMPSQLRIFRTLGDRRLPEAKIDIMSIDLDPGLSPETMRRPQL